MRRIVATLTILLAILAADVAAAAGPEWRSQQPLGPEGRTPLGKVGDLECWDANRCLLTTAGNGGLPAGLYAYDGTGWYLYSTVCGGKDGRIAWTGPTEFWTVSDQQPGQETSLTPQPGISLCHFKDGAVVASYAEPLGVAGSYLPMKAAACLTTQECWFAGERLPGTVNVGAFHLYWNGLSVGPTPSLITPEPGISNPGRAVVDLAYHAGALYESVRVASDDEAPGEATGEPRFLHRVLPGEPSEFIPAPAGPIDLGGASPELLNGFLLSDDGAGLWAISGGAAPLGVTALRLAGTEFEQLSLDDPTPAFSPGDTVSGVAAEPGADAAWVAFRRSGDFTATAPARLALVHANGVVDPPLELPVEGEGIGRQGRAGPVECAAPGQCWLATEKGWLFHLGPDPKPNTDPAMHTLVTLRPRDASLPTVPPISLPVDDSGSNSGGAEIPVQPEETLPKTVPPIVGKLRQRMLDGNVLELSFLLRKKARVRLLAWREGKVVARTRQLNLKPGRHAIELRLNPDRWPTRLDLKVKAIKRGSKK